MRTFYLLAVTWAMFAGLLPTQTRAGNSPAPMMTASIGDFVWRDLDSDGIQDGGEPGLANVYVELQNSAGGWVNAVFTNSNGGYSFTGVAPGSYKIKFANPGGFFQSPQAAVGSTTTNDSDADINGFTPLFTVAAGQVISNIDAGFKPMNVNTCSLTLTGTVGAKTCNDNGTPGNAADDVYSFSFNASITTNPNNLPIWGYKLQINNQTFHAMYDMPINIGPIPVSTGTLTWTLVDDDNPTCIVTGTVTPPAPCSPGGNCPTAAVRTISNTPINCGVSASTYGFWFANLNPNLSPEWVWESGSLMENSDGTALMTGIISNKTKVNAKFAVDIMLTGRTFSAPVGSPKTDGACAGTSATGWYFYTGFSGHLTGLNDPTANELAGASLSISGFGPKPQFGTGASLRNSSANGGSAWLNYTISMQPVNVSLQLNANPAGSQGGDFNIQLSGSPLTICQPPVCNDVTNGGQIGSNEAGCPPFNPSNMVETVAPAGGSGAFEYIWLSSTSGCPTSVSQTIAGATGATYDPGVIAQTTWYTRCTRRAGCTNWGPNNEANCIKKEVKTTGCNTCNDVTSGGQIGSDESACPPFNPSNMVETVAPAGGSGAFEYIWLSSTSGCPTSVSQTIAGATGATYDPGVITQTTWYTRCTRRAGCTNWGPNNEANCVKKEVKTVGCGGGTPDCNAITITPGSGNIVIGGLVAPVIMIQAFNASWAQVFNETYTNSPGTVTIPSLANGIYYVKVNFLNASWASICPKDGYFTVGGTPTPVLTMNCTNNITVTAAAGQTSMIVNYTAPTASSTCTVGSVSVSKTSGLASGSAFPVGTSTVVYTATDGCGNVKTCSFTVTVNPAPACSLNINISNLQCDGKGTATTSDDTYTFNMTVTGTGTGATWSGGFDNAWLGAFAFGPTAYGTTIPMGPFPAGAFTPGNVNPPFTLPNGVDINIHVNDTQNTACSKNITVNSPGPCSTQTGPDCSAITITGGAGNIVIGGLVAPIIMIQAFNASWTQVFNQTYSNSPGTVTIPGLANGVYYVKVDFLNASWMAICQKEGTVNVGGGGGTCTLTYGFTEANKICNDNGTPNNPNDDTWTVDFTASVLTNPLGLPTWGWTATINGVTVNGMYDMVKHLGPFLISAGNLTFTWTDDDNPTCSKSVLITPPACVPPPSGSLTFICLNNITVNAAVGQNSVVVTYTAPTATSTCTVGSVSVVKTSGLASGSAFPIGTSTVVYTATDGCGNVKTCSFTVTVNPPPTGTLTFNCTANSIITATGPNGATVTWTDPTASSTCPVGSVSVTQTSGPAKGSTLAVGTYTIVYTATDGCGNSKTCSFTVEVKQPVCLTWATRTISNTPKDCALPGGSQYGFWFTGLSGGLSSQYWLWESGAMTENGDGTATMTGVIKNSAKSTAKFNVSITLSGRTFVAPSGSPKTDGACSGTNTSGWYYYTGLTGTLTGTGDLAGGSITISRVGPAIQLGNGASLHSSTANGISSWLSYSIGSQPTSNTYKFNACAANSNCADINAQLSGNPLTDCAAPPCNKNILFVVGNTNLNTGDAAIKAKLESKGFILTIKSASSSSSADATGKALVIISSTVNSGDVNTKFKHVPVPVLTWESQIFDDMCMATTYGSYPRPNNASYDCKTGNSYTGHPICSGLAQDIKCFSNYQDVSWGVPNVGQCDYLSDLSYASSKCGAYAYGKGKTMCGSFNAPDKRIGFCLDNDAATDLTPDGWKLFLNCVYWATGCPNVGYYQASNSSLTFDAYRKNFDVELKWLNNTGDKNDFFDIERSADGLHFSKIARVEGEGPKGDQLYFQAFDREPMVGDNIYRLKMVWHNGTVTYTDEKLVNFESIPAIALFPNPTSDEVKLDIAQFAGEKVTIRIVSQLGKQVFSQQIDDVKIEPLKLDLTDFATGQYTVFIENEHARPTAKKLVITRL